MKNIEEISYGKIAFLALNDNIRKKEKIGTFLCERLKKLYDDISQKLGNEKSEAKMNRKNLQRAGEIAEELPQLTEARSLLSEENTTICVTSSNGKTVPLPHSIRWNIIQTINVAINKLDSEIATL